MGEESSPHDNDADARPRVYMRTATTDGEVEVTVRGSETETSEDITDIAEERFEQALESLEHLSDPDESRCFD